MFTGSQYEPFIDVNVLKQYDQESLFQKYTGVYPDLNSRYKSIIRVGDRSPGCRFKWHSGLLYFVDNVPTGGKMYYNIADVVARLCGVSLKKAMHTIVNGNDVSVGLQSVQVAIKSRDEIRFKWIDWEESNYFGLPPSVLRDEHVYRVSEYWIKSDEWRYNPLHNPRTTLCIAYYFPVTDHVKLYFPEKHDYRWYTNCDESDVFGRIKLNYYLETNDDLIVITKSQKDRLILDYDLSIPAIAPQSENHPIPSRVISKVKRFKQALILYDSDKAGQYFAGVLSEATGIPWINLDLAKDLFEFKQRFGIHHLKTYFSCLINQE